MQASSVLSNAKEHQVKTTERPPTSKGSPVLVYVDALTSAQTLMPNARALAEALKVPVTLLHVLELPAGENKPIDPVEWSIRRQEANGRFRRMAEENFREITDLDVKVTQGRPADQICRCARELDACITVAGISVEKTSVGWELGDTTRKLIDRSYGALLLVPPSAGAVVDVHYRRVLVPLDGSSAAESVLPLAARVARASGAELLLAHITPTPELTETAPLGEDDHKLRQQVSERNERVARSYVDQICSRLANSGIAVRGLVVSDGDVRGKLSQLLADEHIDLLIMSAHGRSSRSDMACGSVAGYMTTHAHVPLLLVPGKNGNRNGRAVKTSEPSGRARNPVF